MKLKSMYDELEGQKSGKKPPKAPGFVVPPKRSINLQGKIVHSQSQPNLLAASPIKSEKEIKVADKPR
jgi:hypothetical protein